MHQSSNASRDTRKSAGGLAVSNSATESPKACAIFSAVPMEVLTSARSIAPIKVRLQALNSVVFDISYLYGSYFDTNKRFSTKSISIFRYHCYLSTYFRPV